MKRSRTAALLLMGAAPLLLTACQGDTEATRSGLYTSVEACVAATNDSATCKQAFSKAEQQAAADAPRFTSRAECEAKYGAEKCVERSEAGSSGQHSFFGPMMAGFFLSQMMRNGSAASGFNSSPAFRDRQNGWQRSAPGSGVYANGVGRGLVPVTATPDRATTMSRGGFGRSGSSRDSSHGFGG